MSQNKGYKKLLKNHNFVKLFIARVISRFGDSIDTIAYGYMVYEMTGSAVLLATLFAVNGIPSVVFNMISGVAVSYMPKKRVVWLCDFGRGLVVVLTGVFYFYGILEVWHLYAFTVLNSTFEAFREPAAMSLFVQIVEQDDFEHATSLNTSASTMAELVGIAIAATLIGLIGSGGAIIVDGVTFLLAGTLILSIICGKEVLSKEKLTFKVYVRDLKEGVDMVMTNPLIRSICLFAGGFSIFLVPFNALQTAYILDVMGLNEYGLSVLGISFLIAMMISSLLVPVLKKFMSSRKLFLMGGIVLGISYFAFGLISIFKGSSIAYVMVAIVSLVMGSTISFIMIPIHVALVTSVDREYLPRIASLINIVALSVIPIGGAIMGVLVSFFEITTLFYIFSIGVIVLFIIQGFNPVYKAFDVKKVVLEEVSV